MNAQDRFKFELLPNFLFGRSFVIVNSINKSMVEIMEQLSLFLKGVNIYASKCFTIF
jgi:hypothetical protein